MPVDGSGAKKLCERDGVELAGGGDGDGAVGGEDAAMVDLEDGCEARAQAADEPDGEAAGEAALVEGEAPGWFEGIADGADRSAARRRARSGRAMAGKRWVCLCVSRWVICDARALQLLNLGEGFAGDVFRLDAGRGGVPGGSRVRDGRKDLPSGPSRLGMVSGGETGTPSVRTMWQPTPRVGWARATATASSNAGPLAMRVAEVRTPAEWSSPMARLMPGVRPKSSALRMRRAGIARRNL